METDLDPIDFKELRALVVTSRCGTITAAARELNIGQPDLTRRLHRLEMKLGIELFVRHARGVKLTQAGTQFANESRLALELLREVAIEVKVSSETLRTLMVPPSHHSYAGHEFRMSMAHGTRHQPARFN